MIETKHLELILAIDKYGSLNKASKALNLTQSALSHQLKSLENYLGLKIFHREGNKLLFTEAGTALKERSELIVSELAALEVKLAVLKKDQGTRYIHGYSQREAQRLKDQAKTVADYLHYDTVWEKGSTILEVGCGVGAQTEIIAQKNPGAKIIAIDIAKDSIEIAKKRIQEAGIKNVIFQLQDIHTLKRDLNGLYDHVFICFVLEHLSQPVAVLNTIKNLVKPGGTITIIEGDHGSTLFYPDNKDARKVIHAQVALQKSKGGNANIGRELYPIMAAVGLKNIAVSPRQIYVDNSQAELVEGFIKNTFTAMIQGIATDLISEGYISSQEFEKGIAGLLRTTEQDGVFSYTFFKAQGSV